MVRRLCPTKNALALGKLLGLSGANVLREFCHLSAVSPVLVETGWEKITPNEQVYLFVDYSMDVYGTELVGTSARSPISAEFCISGLS